jgi:outer membrane receptor protein involved in Fe transport
MQAAFAAEIVAGHGSWLTFTVLLDRALGVRIDDFEGDFERDTGPGGINEIKATWYHDVSVFWKAPWKGRFTVGVNNVLAQDPPLAFTTFANSFDPAYEIPGRFIYVRYSQSF